MSGKHTPGRWERVEMRIANLVVVRAVDGNTSKGVAMCTEENANLVAAAPELLEALKGALDLLGEFGTANVAWDRVVAKAEGRA
jgi:hypothetical protein